MSARDDILASVRAAVTSVEVAQQEVPRGYRDTPVDGDLLALFFERVEDYRAIVTVCTEDDLAAQVAKALLGCANVIVPDGLGLSVPSSTPDSGQNALELNEIDAVVTTASVGIAETGTIVLEHGRPGQGRRALSLVPDRHVCIVRAGQVVADVPQAFARLDPAYPQTWISGPSATSDIELNRVEGVHGPRTLHVLLVS